MTRGMTADEMNALADSRVRPAMKPKPKPKPTPRPAGQGTSVLSEAVAVFTEDGPAAAPPTDVQLDRDRFAAFTATPTPLQNTQDASGSTTAGVDAQSAAVALAAIQLGLTAAMGALAGENNPADHTANAIRRAYEAQNIQLHGQSDDDGAPPDADALSDGIPSDYGPGHED